MQAACSTVFDLQGITMENTVGELRMEIHQKLGVDEGIQVLSCSGIKLNDKQVVLLDVLDGDDDLVQLRYNLDGAGVCYVCLVVKVEGGGCGCCPMRRCGFCWEEWPEEEDNEEGDFHIRCSIQ